MDIPKKYFHDRLVLLLLAVNAFLALLTSLLILFRLGGHTNGYFVQFRSNLGLNAYAVGGSPILWSFIVFAFLVFAFHTYLSLRTYHIRRNFAVTILALGTLLLVLAMIVSNALLVLR